MKRSRSSYDGREEVLAFLRIFGTSVHLPLVVIGAEGRILFANADFLGFTAALGKGFLIQDAEQVSMFLPDRDAMDRVWKSGDSCTVEVSLPLGDATVAARCDCIPFIDGRQRTAMVALMYQVTRPVQSPEYGKAGSSAAPENPRVSFDQSCREFEAALEGFSRGNLLKTGPVHPDDPLGRLMRYYNEGIDQVQKMLSLRGLFG